MMNMLIITFNAKYEFIAEDVKVKKVMIKV